MKSVTVFQHLPTLPAIVKGLPEAMSDYTLTKTCSKCGIEKPATPEFFYKKKNGLYGLFSWCKKCHNQMTLVTSTAWNKNNPERVKKSQEKYRKLHPDKVASHKRQWHKANPQKSIDATRRYRKANPDKKLAIQHRYVARKRGLPDFFTAEQWIACLEYHNHCCAVCGNQLRDLFGNIEPHRDHWIPLANPECLGTVAENMICLCNNCNQSKGAKPPTLWLIERYGENKAKQILERIHAYFVWAMKQKYGE